jgi:hypothetical protein
VSFFFYDYSVSAGEFKSLLALHRVSPYTPKLWAEILVAAASELPHLREPLQDCSECLLSLFRAMDQCVTFET